MKRPKRIADSSPRPPGRPAPRPSARADPGLWLYGDHAARAAAANPKRRCRRLVAVADAAGHLEAAAAESGVPRPKVEIVDRRRIDDLLGTDAAHQGAAHQGIAVLADPVPAESLSSVLAGSGGRPFVVLDQVTDPRNVGAVMRAAAAFGAAAVVVQDRHAPTETGTLAKAASGALESVPLVRVVNIARALRELQSEGYRALGLTGSASPSIADIAEAGGYGPVALVLGSEGAGLRRLVRETCDILVRIPISQQMESLNVSTAAAIALYVVSRSTS